jgi:pyrroline-5-carboxylate reductase
MKITFPRRRQHGQRADRRLLRTGLRPGQRRDVIEPGSRSARRLAVDYGVACHERRSPKPGSPDIAGAGGQAPADEARPSSAVRPETGNAAGRQHRRRPRLADISRWLGGHRRIVRCMPNTPALIGAGITGLYACRRRAMTQRAAGRPRPEAPSAAPSGSPTKRRSMRVTAISGSGPAYVFLFHRGAAAGGMPSSASRRNRPASWRSKPSSGRRRAGRASRRSRPCCANASPPRAARPKPPCASWPNDRVKEGIVAGCHQGRRGARPRTGQDARSRLMQAGHFPARRRRQFFLHALPAPFHDAGDARFLCRPDRRFRRQALTNWAVKPLRRIIPGLGGFDWASLLAASAAATAADRHPAARPGRPMAIERRSRGTHRADGRCGLPSAPCSAWPSIS